MSDEQFGVADVYNIEDISFPTATESWGLVTAIGFFDVSIPIEQGNLLMYGPCPLVNIHIGSTPRFRAADQQAAPKIQPGIDFFFDME